MDRRKRVKYRREKARERARGKAREGEVPVGLVISGILFLVLVGAKLVSPTVAGRWMETLGDLMGREADFAGGLEAMGRAISGEGTVSESLQEAYRAVFSPTADSPEEEGTGANAADTGNGVSANSLMAQLPSGRYRRYITLQLPALHLQVAPLQEKETSLEVLATGSNTDEGMESVDVDVGEETIETLSYMYNLPALPENASLEQRNLGFAHETPVEGTLSSGFGWRTHPVEGETRFHYGVDLAAAEGTAIGAFADGAVYATGESSTLGKYIMLEHIGGYITLYAHCSAITVTDGSVTMGEKIAEVGETGLATGPHVHFELHDGEMYLNPIYYVEVG